MARAEKGKGEQKFKEIDAWPIVIKENILPETGSAEKLMAFAQRCGGAPMVDFCFKNWDKLPSLVDKSWRVEKFHDFVETLGKPRMEILRDALGLP